MTTIKFISGFSAIFLTALAVQAQSAFQNLDFESATPSKKPITGPIEGAPYQLVGLALPDWTAYIGDVQQTEVLQNNSTAGLASIDLFGPNYPAAGYPPSVYNPGTIDGNYSVLLQAGFLEDGITQESASIAQYGPIPQGDQSLEFRAWTYGNTGFTVSFNGNNLSPILLGTGANYALYEVDISTYASESGTLQFTAPFFSSLGLDDIAFSPVAVVPEPSVVALTAIGGLLFGARKWFARH